MSNAPPVRSNWVFVILLVAALAFVVAGRLPGWLGLATLANTGYTWALLLGGVALLLGVVNVLWLHIRRIAEFSLGEACSPGALTPSHFTVCGKGTFMTTERASRRATAWSRREFYSCIECAASVASWSSFRPWEFGLSRNPKIGPNILGRMSIWPN